MNKWDRKKFCQRLEDAKDVGKITDLDIAEACGISAAAVGRWRRKNRPPIEHVFLAAQVLGVSPSWLCFGEGAAQLTAQEIADLKHIAGLSVEERAGVREIVRLLLHAHRPPIRAMPPVDVSRELDDTGPDSDAGDRSENTGIA